jgi:hypothetical protein
MTRYLGNLYTKQGIDYASIVLTVSDSITKNIN